jgi:type II secretory pathway component PulM
MSLRRIALALTLLAAAIYLGVSLPAASRLQAARAELRDLQQRLDARAAGLSEERRREEALLRAGRPAETATLMDVRQDIVSTVDRAALNDVRVDVRPGRAPAVALVRVAAKGPFADLLGLAHRLAEPGSGLVLDRVQLARSAGSLSLEVNGRALGPLR